MRSVVGANFFAFSTRFEGWVPFFYLDVKGLVTIGIGNLVDPIELAVGLPMVLPDGSYASWAQIEDAWHAVKARQDLKLAGGGHYADVLTKAGLPELRLTKEGVEDLVLRKLASVDKQLAARFPAYPSACADAQLAAISCSWAAGAGWSAPKFSRAFNAGDFARYEIDPAKRLAAWRASGDDPSLPAFKRNLLPGCAAMEAHLDDRKNPGLVDRNTANMKLLENAQIVRACGLDPDVLYYPEDATPGGESGPPPTVPEGPAAA